MMGRKEGEREREGRGREERNPGLDSGQLGSIENRKQKS